VAHACAHHLDVVQALKVAIAGFAVVVLINLMLLALLLGWPGFITTVTLPGEVVLVFHVLPASILAAEIWLTT